MTNPPAGNDDREQLPVADRAGRSPSRDEVSDPPATGGYRSPRIDYRLASLSESDLLPSPQAPTPWANVRAWLDAALAAGADPLTSAALPEPLAMVLGTVAADGRPRSRTVLLRNASPSGFTFFTNHDSAKGRDIAGTPWVSLLFGWYPLQRQLIVRGVAERVSAQVTHDYFVSRPWGSRIGAWASAQSRPLAERAELDARVAQLAARWPDRGRPDDVPVPPHWGGYLVRPVEVELWQGRSSRLHDRLAFVPRGEAGPPPVLDDASAWRVERRQP
ncbi:MAG: pyridoxamine 5'-phosphate oxidase [Kineosporiaceae bacterium]